MYFFFKILDSDEDNVDVGEFIRTNVGKCSAMFEAAISNSDGLKCEAVDKEHSKSGNDTDNAVVSADYEMDSNSVIAVSEMGKFYFFKSLSNTALGKGTRKIDVSCVGFVQINEIIRITAL